MGIMFDSKQTYGDELQMSPVDTTSWLEEKGKDKDAKIERGVIEQSVVSKDPKDLAKKEGMTAQDFSELMGTLSTISSKKGPTLKPRIERGTPVRGAGQLGKGLTLDQILKFGRGLR